MRFVGGDKNFILKWNVLRYEDQVLKFSRMENCLKMFSTGVLYSETRKYQLCLAKYKQYFIQ